MDRAVEDTSSGAPGDGIQGMVQSLQSRGSEESKEAAGLIEKLFGGLVEAEQVESSEFDGSDTLSVVLAGANGALGEIATKSRVPLEVVAEKTMTARVEEMAATGALALHITGLFFEPVADITDLYTKAMSYRPTAQVKVCKKE